MLHTRTAIHASDRLYIGQLPPAGKSLSRLHPAAAAAQEVDGGLRSAIHTQNTRRLPAVSLTMTPSCKGHGVRAAGLGEWMGAAHSSHPNPPGPLPRRTPRPTTAANQTGVGNPLTHQRRVRQRHKVVGQVSVPRLQRAGHNVAGAQRAGLVAHRAVGAGDGDCGPADGLVCRQGMVRRSAGMQKPLGSTATDSCSKAPPERPPY